MAQPLSGARATLQIRISGDGVGTARWGLQQLTCLRSPTCFPGYAVVATDCRLKVWRLLRGASCFRSTGLEAARHRGLLLRSAVISLMASLTHRPVVVATLLGRLRGQVSQALEDIVLDRHCNSQALGHGTLLLPSSLSGTSLETACPGGPRFLMPRPAALTVSGSAHRSMLRRFASLRALVITDEGM
jgi:hypothetical protein